MSKKIVKKVIRNEEGWIVAVVYEDDTNVKYNPSYSTDGQILMEVEILIDTNYVGSIMCWKGSIETTTLVLTEEGTYKEV